MTDPIRWSEAKNAASSIEQLLVRAGQEVSMPSDEKAAIWQNIVSAVPAAAPIPSNGSNTLAASSLTKAVGLWGSVSLLALKAGKIVLVIAALAALGVGAYRSVAKSPVTQSSGPALTAAPPSVSATPAEPPVQAAPEPLPPESAAADSAVAPAVRAAPSRASQLKEESLAVMAARQALRSNDAARALQLLDQAQARFKHGGLAEEREALTIEALAKLGQKGRASALARAFLSHYPRSPHAADVQRFAQ